MEKTVNRRPSPWLIWGLATTFFCFEFLTRVAPSSMIPDLMLAFSVGASGIGFINACYFYLFAPMQIPVGLLMDKYGARKLLSISSFIITLGCFFFGAASGIFLASLGRALMGLGSACGFVAVVFISSHWFPKNRVASLVGIANSVGMLGAVLGQGPTSLLREEFGWRATFFIMTAIGALITILIFLYLQDDPDKKAPVSSSPKVLFLENLRSVCKGYLTWSNAAACFLYYSLTSVFAGLWGISFLVNVHGMDNEAASFAVSLIFVGWVIGGPVVGRLSDYFQTEKIFLTIGPLGALFCITPVLYIAPLSSAFLHILLFLVGVFSSPQILHYTVSIELNASSAKGTAISLTNFVTMMGASFLQPLVGYLLDANWQGKVVEGVRIYPTEAWQIAVSLFPLALFVTFLINLLLPKRTHEDHPEVSF